VPAWTVLSVLQRIGHTFRALCALAGRPVSQFSQALDAISPAIMVAVIPCGISTPLYSPFFGNFSFFNTSVELCTSCLRMVSFPGSPQFPARTSRANSELVPGCLLLFFPSQSPRILFGCASLRGVAVILFNPHDVLPRIFLKFFPSHKRRTR